MITFAASPPVVAHRVVIMTLVALQHPLSHDHDARGAVCWVTAPSAGLQSDPERDGRSLWRLAVWAVMDDGVQRPHLVDRDREAQFLQDVRGPADRQSVDVGDRYRWRPRRDRNLDDLALGKRAARGLRLADDRPRGHVAFDRDHIK